jgi:hypothetical protein
MISNVLLNERNVSGVLCGFSQGSALLFVLPHLAAGYTTIGSPSSMIGNSATAVTAVAND